ncbi:hypothetical protein LNQ03_08320 [Klebsiella pneumoniae subsp. pneumoniae]|nr:hypothetical protein [Klebsiella pneumoniae subsp. pneumoniae]
MVTTCHRRDDPWERGTRPSSPPLLPLASALHSRARRLLVRREAAMSSPKPVMRLQRLIPAA